MTGIDIILLAVFLLGHCVASLYTYRMLQLNAYKTGVYVRWFIQETKKELSSTSRKELLIYFVAGIMSSLLGISDFWFWFFALGLLCVCIVWYSWIEKDKKPLMYTTRVIRMFATHSIIIALILFLMLPITNHHQILFLFLLVFFTPLTVILVNFINYPIEKAIEKLAPVSDADSWEKIDENHGGCND